jgi:arginase family enzyme
MRTRILDLDGSVTSQDRLVKRHQPGIQSRLEWGPLLRLACSHKRFQRFELSISGWLRTTSATAPAVTFIGSGDFHHVSLALVRNAPGPFNLLVIDNHPDWMRGVPFLHCGTWLYQAARLPHVQSIFHVGGDVDFDNYYSRKAPRSMLESGKITVFPGIRTYDKGGWSRLPNAPVRKPGTSTVDPTRLTKLLRPHWDQLSRYPLYISLDKDVMVASDAAVNWDSGHLRLPEVESILRAFLSLSGGKMAGMDIVGDWSPVQVRGLMRRFFHMTMHPSLSINPSQAAWLNEETNIRILDTVQGCVGQGLSKSA